MSSPAALHRLRRIAATIVPESTSRLELTPCAGRDVEEVFGEAAARFSSLKVAILQIGDRGVPVANSKEYIADKFKQRSLDVVFVQAEKDIPSDISVIITTGFPVGAELLAKAPSLKLVASAFTGVDHIDLEACQARGITVTNVPDYSTEATAELVIGLVISQLRQIPRCNKVILDGQWAAPPQEDLSTKTVGIIGMGKIGRRLAELFRAFKVKGLRAYDPKWQPSGTPAPAGYPGWSPKQPVAEDHEFAALGGIYVDSLAQMFLDSDIVCICVPLTSKTKGLISEKLLDLLRPNSLIVNVSRGDVVDEAALAKHLNQGRFQAALDVFGAEPLPKDSPLRSVPQGQLIMTPHVGYQSVASLEKRLDVTVKNILAFLAGHAVNVVA